MQIKLLKMQLFKGDNIVFSITAVNHDFDCKGGWETSLETAMRIV